MTIVSVEQMRTYLFLQNKTMSSAATEEAVRAKYIEVLEGGGRPHEYRRTIGSLECDVVTNCIKPRFLVFLLHGIGSGGFDFVDVAEAFFSSQDAISFPAAFIFPYGIIDMGDQEGNCWWPVDIGAMAMRIIGGMFGGSSWSGIADDEPDGVEPARVSVLRAMEEASVVYGVPKAAIGLGGFSQGAMLSLDLFFCMDPPPFMLWLFSPGPMSRTRYRELWKKQAKAWKDERLEVPVYRTHGSGDMTIPIFAGNLVEELLRELGFNVRSSVNAGGHTIEPDVIAAFCEALRSHCPLHAEDPFEAR